MKSSDKSGRSVLNFVKKFINSLAERPHYEKFTDYRDSDGELDLDLDLHLSSLPEPSVSNEKLNLTSLTLADDETGGAVDIDLIINLIPVNDMEVDHTHSELKVGRVTMISMTPPPSSHSHPSSSPSPKSKKTREVQLMIEVLETGSNTRSILEMTLKFKMGKGRTSRCILLNILYENLRFRIEDQKQHY